jgi:hypothetical protein
MSNNAVEAPRALSFMRHDFYNIIVSGDAALTGAVPHLVRQEHNAFHDCPNSFEATGPDSHDSGIPTCFTGT